jgi:hypothetical protein
VTVIYPPQQAASPVLHEYDSYGREIPRGETYGWSSAGGSGGSGGPAVSGGSGTSSASPIYLFAFKDHSIRAAAAYWVDGTTLHYVTLEHESRQVPLDSVDRELSNQLNRERRVQLSLPGR